jgi:hypothetical protein
MSIFAPDDLTKPDSKAYLDRLAKIVDSTSLKRYKQIEALRTDIKVLSKKLQDLKTVEEEYFQRYNILSETVAGSGLIEGGKAAPNPIGTDPEFQAENQNSIYAQYKDESALIQNRDLITGPGTVFSVPEVTLAKKQLMDKIPSISKNVLRYHHLIKQTRLTIETKRLQLEALIEESEKLQGDS